MAWLKVIIFAVITGAYIALVNSLPFLNFLQDTSFRNIAVSFEWWILFAIFIVVNCKKPWEASLKCFVFFLISQPLVYLVESPFLGLHVFTYYRYWFYVTLLTLPGVFIAWYVKKSNALSAVILSVACGLLGIETMEYIKNFIKNPPHHILTIIFCVAQIVFLIAVLMRGKKEKIISAICSVVVIAGFFTYTFVISNGNYFKQEAASNATKISLNGSADWKVQSYDEDKLMVDKNDDGSKNSFIIIVNQTETEITDKVVFEDNKGNTATCTVNYTEKDGLMAKCTGKGIVKVTEPTTTTTTVAYTTAK